MDSIEQDDTISIKIPILHRTIPYVYIKASTVCNSYRLSGNYKYLNEHYQLKINFIRDLHKVEKYHWANKYFNIDNNCNIEIDLNSNWQTWNLSDTPNNILTINRLIVKDALGDSTIIVLNRNYNSDLNSSLFFASSEYFSINQFLDAHKEGK